jgi:hypothetical protein
VHQKLYFNSPLCALSQNKNKKGTRTINLAWNSNLIGQIDISDHDNQFSA